MVPESSDASRTSPFGAGMLRQASGPERGMRVGLCWTPSAASARACPVNGTEA
jgi:hypothetical protein